MSQLNLIILYEEESQYSINNKLSKCYISLKKIDFKDSFNATTVAAFPLNLKLYCLLMLKYYTYMLGTEGVYLKQDLIKHSFYISSSIKLLALDLLDEESRWYCIDKIAAVSTNAILETYRFTLFL